MGAGKKGTKPKPKRYFVQFTPVGWQVRDRQTGEEMASFGTGSSEYLYALEEAARLNREEK